MLNLFLFKNKSLPVGQKTSKQLRATININIRNDNLDNSAHVQRMWLRFRFGVKMEPENKSKKIKLVLNIFIFLILESKYSGLTYFLNFWPRVTSGDLATWFFEELRSRASFWYIIYLISKKSSKFDLFLIFDLGFFKAHVKSLILIINLPTFNELRNLTPNDPRFEIWPQTKIFDLK